MRLFVGDTETAGQDPGPGGVCEIALIEIEDDLEYISHFESRIDPEVPICPGASGIHGITNDDVKDQPTLREWADIVRIHEMGLAAHNVKFDADKMSGVFKIPLTLDTLRLAQRFIPGAPNYKLATLVYFCRLPRAAGAFHSAMTDTWSCYYLLKLIANESGLKTFSELAKESNTPRILEKFPPFGRYASKPFSEIDDGYLKWCMKNFETMDMDLEFTIKQRLGL